MASAPLLPTADDVARRIKAARVLAGLSAPALAERCGWDVSKVYRLERAEQVPDAIELHVLAQALGQSVGWLLGTSLESAGADGSQTEAQPVDNVKGEAA